MGKFWKNYRFMRHYLLEMRGLPIADRKQMAQMMRTEGRK